MLIQAIGRVSLTLALVGAFTSPTAAQPSAVASTLSGRAPVNISAGYNFYREQPEFNVPLGLYLAVNSNGRVGLAGELDGFFRSLGEVSVKGVVALGGVRFAGNEGRGPYGQVLVGVVHAIASGSRGTVTNTLFTIAPGVGADIMPSGSSVGVRVQAAALFERNRSVGWAKAFTFGIGIVAGVGK